MFNIFKKKVDRLLPLPLSVPELDAYVAELCKEFDLPNTDDTYENVCTMLLHAPPSVCKAPMRFFGESVKKSIVNQAAYAKAEEFRNKREVKRKADQEAKALAEMHAAQKSQLQANQISLSTGIAQSNQAATQTQGQAVNGQTTQT